MKLQTLRTGWNAFWFIPQSVLPIAMFRIAFGVLVLTYGLVLAPDLLLWFGGRGVLSLQLAEATGFKPHINLLALLPSGDGWVVGFFLIFMAAALALTLGLFTRLSSIAVWLGLATLYNRNLTIANGGTILMLIFSFLLIFAPAGVALSLDRLWRVRRGKNAGPPPDHPPWAQRLIQIQLTLVYVVAFFLKTSSAQWVQGTALYYVARSNLWVRFGIPLAQFPLATTCYSWATLVLELSLPCCLWIDELRVPALLAGLVFHLFMEYSLNIPWFQFTMLTAYLTFIDAAALKALPRAWRRRFAS